MSPYSEESAKAPVWSSCGLLLTVTIRPVEGLLSPPRIILTVRVPLVPERAYNVRNTRRLAARRRPGGAPNVTRKTSPRGRRDGRPGDPAAKYSEGRGAA